MWSHSPVGIRAGVGAGRWPVSAHTIYNPRLCSSPTSTPEPASVRVYRCAYSAPCRAPRCRPQPATLILRKLDAAGRPLKQVELCDAHSKIVITRERARGLEIRELRD